MPLDSSWYCRSYEADADLLRLLMNLGASKHTGELDDEESLANQTILWRNRLEYDVFKKCLRHFDDAIRLQALKLLVESRKSTQCFTEIELDMIIMFLRYNLGERMEYVPLIKKALKRVQSSLAVLRRNVVREEKIKDCEKRAEACRELYEQLRQESAILAKESLDLIEVYKKFYLSFRDICTSGLCPGSTNCRKGSSLRMLQLGQEYLAKEFADLPWSREQADILFQCLLLDTYETNKEIVYEIAKTMEPNLLRLDEVDRVREIIDVALDLGNCIRPIDGITASYMLKIALLSPVIIQALDIYPNGEIHSLIETREQATLRLIAIAIDRLKDPLKLAEENIVAAAGKHSLYGHLFCVRSLLATCDLRKVVMHDDREIWIRIVAEIIEVSFRLNNAVSRIVNNSSPEGHFPMDMESGALSTMVSTNETTLVTPQMVLLCSWRTVKEVSLLFGHLSSHSPIVGENAQTGLLDEKQLVDIGEHLVTLLFETKHRGAFEQAHVGFGQLCNRLWRLEQTNLNELPKIWLHHLLLAVSGLSPGNAKLCATRRSAGVPFMVQALVSSDPKVQSYSSMAVFHSVMKILLGFTDLEEGAEVTERTKSIMYDGTIFTDLQDTDFKYDDEKSDAGTKNHETITEIKTHALNILRALFKHALLGDLSRTYAADGLKAAIRSYDGKTWAERNAATLLFSSLITRIFGVQRTKDHFNLTLDNRMTGRIFFEKYPSLLTFMLGELSAFVESSDTLIKPSVQSILLLLSRLYPSFNSNDSDVRWKIDEFVKLVSACGKSRVYKTRELAARALVPLLTESTSETSIVDLFEATISGRSGGSSYNALHGYTLQILEIISSPQFTLRQLSRGQVESFLVGTEWIVKNLEIDNDRSACFPLATACVTVISELVISGGLDMEKIESSFHRLMPHLSIPRSLKRRPGREIYELAVAKFFIVAMENQLFRMKFRVQDDFISAWKHVLSHDNVRAQTVAWNGIHRVIGAEDDEKLLETAIIIARNNITRNIVDPDLLEALYDFLHDALSISEKSNFSFDVDSTISCFVVSILARNTLENNCLQGSPSFLKLLGKAYGKLSQSYKDEYLTVEDKRAIYKLFFDKTWMGSADIGFRRAISGVLRDLFVETRNIDCCDYYISLDWWTFLLNLLVDDNSLVREQASMVICKIEPPTKLECISVTIDVFFDKFIDSMRESPNVAFAALFAWSTSLSGDTDYEMDESDVFNKCYNYEIYEPLRIADLCTKKMEFLYANYSMNDELPVEVRDWLSEKLGGIIDASSFTNSHELVEQYGKIVPIIGGKLNDIIDPTHNDKLLQAMTYERLVAAIS